VSSDLLTVGKITGHFGVKGGVKVFSFTQPMDNITHYRQWYVGGRVFKGIKAKKHGKTIVAQVPDINSREDAQALIGQMVSVDMTQLSPLSADDYYWYQLIGLSVIDQNNQVLGRVESMFETGANDVMVVKPTESADDETLLIPYLYGQTVTSVNLQTAEMRVDWTDSDQPDDL
jgi:16S rRNA processing protein RimM